MLLLALRCGCAFDDLEKVAGMVGGKFPVNAALQFIAVHDYHLHPDVSGGQGSCQCFISKPFWIFGARSFIIFS